MDLLVTPEQEAIVAASAAFLAGEMPLSAIRRRRSVDQGTDRTVWKRCAELGWFGLGLAEGDGGVGYSLAEEALLFREIGRFLAPGPFVASVLGARLAIRCGAVGVAGRIMDGSCVVGLAQPQAGAEVAIGTEVTGAVDLVDAGTAEFVLVAGRGHLALVESTHLAAVEPLDCLDPAVCLGTGRLESAPAWSLDGADEARLWNRGNVLISATQVGIAEATRDMAASYAKERVQFDRPIGVNQAIKHRCADMAIRAEAAASQLLFAALCAEMDRSDAAFQVGAARVVADDASIRNSQENIQVHGGIGYTSEHNANLYMRRAQVTSRLIGDSRQVLDALVHLPAPV